MFAAAVYAVALVDNVWRLLRVGRNQRYLALAWQRRLGMFQR